MISVKTFLAKVEDIACEEPSYRIGGTGTDGTCDCIGLIVGAVRRAGGTWTGRKGCNYAARNEVLSLTRIERVADLTVGEAVFKAREPGEKGYDAETIRNSYADSADKRDYYHIGVVESVLPLRIRHMTTPMMKMDTTLGKWKYHGWLGRIRQDADGDPDTGAAPAAAGNNQGGELEMAAVLIYGGALGSPVNMRTSGSLQAPILGKIPQYTRAELLAKEEKWSRVRYGSKIGYVQNVFVHEEDSADPEAAAGSEADSSRISIRREKLEAVYDEIGDWLGLRG